MGKKKRSGINKTHEKSCSSASFIKESNNGNVMKLYKDDTKPFRSSRARELDKSPNN